MDTAIASTRCYIDEYVNEQGRASARLREKRTGRKVDLGFADTAAQQHFLQFLSAAERHGDEMPEVFDKDGDADCVVVSGDLDFDAPDEIRFIFNERLAYAFG